MLTTSFVRSVLRRLRRKSMGRIPLRSRCGGLPRPRVEQLESRALPSASGVLNPGLGAPTATAWITNPNAVGDAVTMEVVNGSSKILVAGYDTINGNQDFALWRFNSDGTLDTSFGQGGLVTTDFGPGQGSDLAEATALTIDPATGDIVAAGYALSSDTGNVDFALAVYNADGSPDGSFGTGGTVLTDFGSGGAQVSAVAVDPSTHQIVAAGYATDPTSGNNDFALARYNFDGSLDTNFGNAGTVLTDFGNGAQASALVIDGNGQYVVGGSAYNGTTYENDSALARYNSDGSLDANFGVGSSSFGPAGTVTTDFGGGDAAVTALAVNANGQYVAAGYAMNGTTGNEDLALARYNADGSLDSAFGSAGTVTTDFTSGSAQANALVIDPGTQQIVVAGSVTDASGNTDFGVTRYNADGSLDGAFGSGGTATAAFSGGSAQVNGLVPDGSGNYVAVGEAFNGSTWNENLAVARVDAAGGLDSSFGSGTGGNLGPAGTVSWQPAGAVPWQPGQPGNGFPWWSASGGGIYNPQAGSVGGIGHTRGGGDFGSTSSSHASGSPVVSGDGAATPTAGATLSSGAALQGTPVPFAGSAPTATAENPALFSNPSSAQAPSANVGEPTQDSGSSQDGTNDAAPLDTSPSPNQGDQSPGTAETGTSSDVAPAIDASSSERPSVVGTAD